jgi:hypothetical protein
MTRWATVSFPRRTLLNTVTCFWFRFEISSTQLWLRMFCNSKGYARNVCRLLRTNYGAFGRHFQFMNVNFWCSHIKCITGVRTCKSHQYKNWSKSVHRFSSFAMTEAIRIAPWKQQTKSYGKGVLGIQCAFNFFLPLIEKMFPVIKHLASYDQDACRNACACFT